METFHNDDERWKRSVFHTEEAKTYWGSEGLQILPMVWMGGGKTIQRDFEGSLSHLHAFLEKLKWLRSYSGQNYITVKARDMDFFATGGQNILINVGGGSNIFGNFVGDIILVWRHISNTSVPVYVIDQVLWRVIIAGK